MDGNPMRVKRLLPLAAIGLLASLPVIVETVRPESLEYRDFQQEYMLALAVTRGLDPYLPLPELGGLTGVPMREINHPSPHPPPAVLLAAPLALFSNVGAALAWLAFGSLCLAASLALLFGLRWWEAVLAYLAALVWWPVFTDLGSGQLTSITLLPLVLSLVSFREGRDVRGGVWLGVAVALKFVGWPVAIYLAIRCRWKACAGAAGVVLAANLVALCVIGPRPFLSYYMQGGPGIARIYRADAYNYSAWSVGHKLFAGTDTAVLTSYAFTAPPLVHAPRLAPYASALCAAVLLFYALWLARRAKTFEDAFAVLVLAGIVLTPVSWPFYLELGLLALTIRRDAVTVLALFAAPLVPPAVQYLAGPAASFPAGLLMLAPLAVVVFLMRRLVNVPRTEPGQQAPSLTSPNCRLDSGLI